jgi:hypothetical protein
MQCQGVDNVARAVQTFADRKGIDVQAHQFGGPRLIHLFGVVVPDEETSQPADGDPDRPLPPIVESDAVVITPVQLIPVCKQECDPYLQACRLQELACERAASLC